MQTCIFGLGAVGGLLAARMAEAGLDVRAVARGATLKAVQERGLELHEEGSEARRVELQVTDRPAEFGPQELVVLALKGHALPAALGDVAALVDEGTTVLTVMNGIPWWFRHGLGAQARELDLDRVDPNGSCSRAIRPEQVLGAVANLTASVPKPGVVRAKPGARLTIGEPTGGADSERCKRVIALMREAGLQTEASERIQQTIWFKLWGNMTGNPISAMTGATGDQMLDDELVRGYMSRCMVEAAAIGARMGVPIDTDPEARHAVTRRLGAFKTSMLQDAEAGRTIELDPIVGVVVDMARQLEVPAPNIEALYGLARLHARTHGLMKAR